MRCISLHGDNGFHPTIPADFFFHCVNNLKLSGLFLLLVFVGFAPYDYTLHQIHFFTQRHHTISLGEIMDL